MKGSRESPTCAFHAHAHPSATSIQAAALRNGSLLLNMRSRELRRLQSYSHDGGETWSHPRPAQPPVPDGNCQGSQISLGDGSLLVATSAGAARIGLHAYLSTDGGGSWRHSLSKTSWRRPRPAGSPEASYQRQIVLQAASSVGPPRPMSRLGRPWPATQTFASDTLRRRFASPASGGAAYSALVELPPAEPAAPGACVVGICMYGGLAWLTAAWLCDGGSAPITGLLVLQFLQSLQKVLEYAAELLTSVEPSGVPSARVGLLYESSQKAWDKPGDSSRPATVLRYTTLAVPLQEPLPPAASPPPPALSWLLGILTRMDAMALDDDV